MHLVAHRDPVLSGLLTVHERLTTVGFVKKKKKKEVRSVFKADWCRREAPLSESRRVLGSNPEKRAGGNLLTLSTIIPSPSLMIVHHCLVMRH